MKIRITLIFILCFLTARNLFSSPDRPNTRQNKQFGFGYWNDNFIYQDFFDKFLKVGADDFVTTSFWSQVARQHQNRWLIFDLYYNILTNKTANYRFDLLTYRLSIEKDTQWALFQFGSGLVFRGNYGGQTIQNAYHELFGYHPVNLTYADETALGLLVLTKVEPYLIKTTDQTLKFSVINIYRSAAGPSNFRVGFSGLRRVILPNSPMTLCLQGRLAYIHYYHLDNLVRPLFSEGLGYGLVFTGIYRNRCGISFWMTENQYGQHNPHYGLMFTYNPHRRFALRISDIMVP